MKLLPRTVIRPSSCALIVWALSPYSLGCASSGASPETTVPDGGMDSSVTTSTASDGQSPDEPGLDGPTDSRVQDQSAGDAPVAPTGADGGAEAGLLDCNSLPLCDDFESDTPLMAPNPNLWHAYMGCTPGAPNAPVSGGGLTIGIDTSRHHSGNNSLRVVGGDSCGYYAINTSAFASLSSQVYARFYANFSGGGGGADAGAATQGHNGFLSMYSGSVSGSDPTFFTNYNSVGPLVGQVRLGFQSNVVDWNDIITSASGMTADTTLPDLSPMGTALSISPQANVWDCYEFHIDQTTNQIEFWFDGVSVSGLTWDGTAVQGVTDQWATQGPPPLQLQSFGLGWLQLGNQETAWFDDVALAGVRIGCE